MDNEKILRNDDISPLNKVYNIARNLHKEHKIPVELWYAVLELKDACLDQIYLVE
jgi:hypothetical protein